LSSNGIEQPEITSSESMISNDGKQLPVTTLLISTPNNSQAAFSGLTQQVEQGLISAKHISSSESIIETSIIGPSVGAYMRTNALRAVIIGIMLMA
jgi:preprotein translocase subunit SecF